MDTQICMMRWTRMALNCDCRACLKSYQVVHEKTSFLFNECSQILRANLFELYREMELSEVLSLWVPDWQWYLKISQCMLKVSLYYTYSQKYWWHTLVRKDSFSFRSRAELCGRNKNFSLRTNKTISCNWRWNEVEHSHYNGQNNYLILSLQFLR